MLNPKHSYKAYSKTDVNTSDQLTLIIMLYDGLLRFLKKAMVKIEENDRSTVGQSADTDTLVASANAYLNALNKMLIKREKKAMNESIKHQKVKGI